jgi:hypothetical protein
MTKKGLTGIEIYPKIISELKKSEKEILVVSDWFTDEKLFDVLLEKQEQGVKVKLIIEENLKNEKEKFSDLTKAGVEIYKIEKEDFGMMHQMYCVIDEKIAVFPLAIRSPYFLVNDHESLIVTGHYKTIQNLKTHFYKLKDGATIIGKNHIESSVFALIKNWVLGIFKINGKETEAKKNDFEKEMILKKEIRFKMIDSSDILNNESNYFFHHRN